MVWPHYITTTTQNISESIHIKNCRKQWEKLPMQKTEGGNYRNLNISIYEANCRVLSRCLLVS